MEISVGEYRDGVNAYAQSVAGGIAVSNDELRLSISVKITAQHFEILSLTEISSAGPDADRFTFFLDEKNVRVVRQQFADANAIGLCDAMTAMISVD